jgi:hypothetical protein
MSHIEEIIGRDLRMFALVLAGFGFRREIWFITWIGIHAPGIGQEPDPWFYMDSNLTLELNPMGPHGLKPNQKLNLTRFKCFFSKGLGHRVR